MLDWIVLNSGLTLKITFYDFKMMNSSGNNILLLMIARIYVVHILSYNCTEFQKGCP